MRRLSPALRAVSDPTRREILRMLREGPRPAGDFVEAFSISQPAVSRHLRVLREAGLVDQTRRSRRQIYTLQAEPLKAIADWVSLYEHLWDDKLDAMEQWMDDHAP